MEILFGLAIFAADVWAILNIIGSDATTGSKVMWSLLIIILPVLGLIIWYFAGPRQ
jgi:hypothetical protein